MKKQIIFLAFVAVLALGVFLVSACGKDEPAGPGLPTEGLVAYYALDGNAQDGSTNQNHGSLKGGVQLVANRKNEPNKAVYFDGDDTHIVIPHSDAINFGSLSFTISVWVKCGDQKNTQFQDNEILSKTSDTYPYTIRLLNNTVLPINGSPGMWVAGRWDKMDNPGATVTKIDDETFHHLVFVKDGNDLFFYTDAEMKKTGKDTMTKDPRNNAPLVIGRRFTDKKDLAFTGVVDDLRIYNRALTAAEITALYKE